MQRDPGPPHTQPEPHTGRDPAGQVRHIETAVERSAQLPQKLVSRESLAIDKAVGQRLQPAPRRLEKQGGPDRHQHSNSDLPPLSCRETGAYCQAQVGKRDGEPEHAIHQRTAEDQVDVEQSMAQEGDRHRDRDQRPEGPVAHSSQPGRGQPVDGELARDRHGSIEHGCQHRPLDLLSLLRRGAPIAKRNQNRRDQHEERQGEQRTDPGQPGKVVRTGGVRGRRPDEDRVHDQLRECQQEQQGDCGYQGCGYADNPALIAPLVGTVGEDGEQPHPGGSETRDRDLLHRVEDPEPAQLSPGEVDNCQPESKCPGCSQAESGRKEPASDPMARSFPEHVDAGHHGGRDRDADQSVLEDVRHG